MKERHNYSVRDTLKLINNSEVEEAVELLVLKYSNSSLDEIISKINEHQYIGLMQEHMKNLIKAEDILAQKQLTAEEKEFEELFGRDSEGLASTAVYLPGGEVYHSSEGEFVKGILQSSEYMLVTTKPNNVTIQMRNERGNGIISAFNSVENATKNSFIKVSNMSADNKNGYELTFSFDDMHYNMVVKQGGQPESTDRFMRKSSRVIPNAYYESEWEM